MDEKDISTSEDSFYAVVTPKVSRDWRRLPIRRKGLRVEHDEYSGINCGSQGTASEFGDFIGSEEDYGYYICPECVRAIRIDYEDALYEEQFERCVEVDRKKGPVVHW